MKNGLINPTMFVDDLKDEFLGRVSGILERTDLTEKEKLSVIGKIFVEFEKRNKSQLSKLVVKPPKEKRELTSYNLFIKEKMGALEKDVFASKHRFKVAASLWKAK